MSGDTMSTKAPAALIMRLLAHSVRVTETAGGLIRDVLTKGDLDIVHKGKNDVQTLADRAAQHCIIGSLIDKFPEHNLHIYGEESYQQSDLVMAVKELGSDESVEKRKCPAKFENLSDDDITIWVDPLDGTSEFSQSLKPGSEHLREHVTVLVGFAVGSDPVAGVIHQPFFHRDPSAKPGRTIWGLVGLGAFGAATSVPPEGSHIITTTRSHSSQDVIDTIEAMEPTEVLKVGGAGNKVLMVIEGKAHAYVFASSGCKKWDTCAPEAVLRAAGGTLTDIRGENIPHHHGVPFTNSYGVLATAKGTDHEWYVSRVAQSVKDSLEKKFQEKKNNQSGI